MSDPSPPPKPPPPPPPPPSPPSSSSSSSSSFSPPPIAPILPTRPPVVTRAPEPVVTRPAFQPNTAPPGHIEYAANISKLRSTRGRGRVAIVVFWLATLGSGFALYAHYSRRAEWRDFVKDSASLDDLDRADHLVNVATVVQIALWVLGGITVAIWARRVAKNAVARGAHNVSVGRATIGWFIPVGFLWIGFSSVRAADTQLGGRGKSVGLWQGAFLFANVAGYLASYRSRSLDVAESAADITNTLNRLLISSAVSFVTLALAAFFGMRAIRDVNHVVCDPPPGYLSQAGRPAS